jgi:hypothetical protein
VDDDSQKVTLYFTSFFAYACILLIFFKKSHVYIFWFTGDIVMVRNALTEQEAYGVEALVTCMQKLLPNDLPFYEERAFGHVDDEDHGLYSGDGGNFCTFVQGMCGLL